jgi:lysophospholipase L1-like esterase
MAHTIRLHLLVVGIAIISFATGVRALSNSEAPRLFALHDGDRVVFYGDSITEQRLYTAYIEEYVLTRFPGLRIDFVNSGVAGDLVSGGVGGPIDLRLERDVYVYHPSIITIMLGMNDGYFGRLEPGILKSYSDGYRRIVEALQAKLPEARLLLIEPSPYDEITRAADFNPGYNSTLLRFGEFVKRLAEEKHTLSVDLNAPVVLALKKAKDLDSSLSPALIQDRVHPGSGVHWIMAEAVLKTWNAPSVVTTVVLDGEKGLAVQSFNTEVSLIRKTNDSLSWIQNDRALPLPLPSADSDPFTALAVRTSHLNDALNQQVLRIVGLRPGKYGLSIDDQEVAEFNAEQFATGVNMALFDNPMLAQARLVALDTNEKNSIESTQSAFVRDPRPPGLPETVKRLESARIRSVERQRKDAQPVPHRYSLSYQAKAAGK